MNALFNSALRQSTSLRKDLDLFADTASPSPSLQGQISASLTSFSRTIDDYNRLAKQEPVATKQEKAFERVKNFRQELEEYKGSFARVKEVNDEVVGDCLQSTDHDLTWSAVIDCLKQTTQARTELLGRRPHHASTPENPYAQQNISSTSSPFATNRPKDPNAPYAANPYSAGAHLAGSNASRESHALREQSFFSQTSNQLDEYLDRGRQVLGDLGDQREMLKGTQRKLYSVANTLGISGDTIRMVERRARQDKWIFWAGVVVFFGFCWLVLHYLR